MPAQVIPENFKQSTSVADQFKNTFKSAVSDLGSAADGFAKSASTSAGDTLQNVSSAASALGKLGLSAGGAVKKALDELGSLGSYSKFQDTFIPPSKLTDLSPQELSNSTKSYLGEFTYPENIGDYFITFNFKAYDRKVPLGNPTELPLITINLPIPSNLQEQFNMSYSEKQLGVAGFLEGVAETALQGGGTPESFRKAGEKLAKGVASSEGLYYGARTLAGLSDTIGSAVDKTTGAVLNPFQALLFQGVNLRTHNFTFKFSPNSSRENEKLKKIIYEFKRRMHPEKSGSGLLFQFPDLVDISFSKKINEPYFFKTCFLETMSLNYAPSNIPAFFAQTSDPVEIEMSLTFKEVEVITRNDFKSPVEPNYGT